MTLISVVIPTFNRLTSLKHCLKALYRQTFPHNKFEIIIIDDGSSDGTIEFLKSQPDSISITLKYYYQNNLGPGAARNHGIKKAQGKYIAFTDDDCIPSPGWLESLLSAFPNDKYCAGVGGSIIRLHNDSISRYIDDSGAMKHPVQNGSTKYLVTANALYKKSCLTKVHGFDTRISWPGGEDPDLSFRLTDQGFYLLSATEPLVRHDHKNTLSGLFRMFKNYGKGNRALVEFKRIKKSNIWISLIYHYFEAPIKYLQRSDLNYFERAAFCFLRWTQCTAFHIGYLSCPNVIRKPQ